MNNEVSNESGSTWSERIKRISDAFLYYCKHLFCPNIIDITRDTTWELYVIMGNLITELGKVNTIKDFIDNFSTRIGEASTNLKKLINVLLREKYGKDAARNIESLHRFKNEIRNLYNQLVNSFKKANSEDDCEEIFWNEESLKNFKNNVIDLLIILEENNFIKKLLENLKERNEIEPIPGTIGLLTISVIKKCRKTLDGLFGKKPNNTQGENHPSTNN